MRRYFRVKWILADLLKTVLLGSTPVEKWGQGSESRDSALTEKTRGSRRDAGVTKKSEERICPSGPERKNRERRSGSQTKTQRVSLIFDFLCHDPRNQTDPRPKIQNKSRNQIQVQLQDPGSGNRAWGTLRSCVSDESGNY